MSEDAPTIDRVHELCALGKFREALQELKELVSQSSTPLQKAGYLVDQATCYRELKQFNDAAACLAEARGLAGTDAMAHAQIEFCLAILLVADDDKREQGLEGLARILRTYEDLLRDGEGRELYEEVQLQRGFSMMNMSKNNGARALLEEALSFHLSGELESRVRCYLARCYFELALYDLAKEQCQLAQALGIAGDWEATFHYYFGYTLYELKDFSRARREFILCLQSGASGPPQSYVYKMLAATSRKLGERDQARLYEKMIDG